MTTEDRSALWLPTASADDDYLGPYRLIREVGSGGMGVVYLGVDPADKAVAVKVLREHVANDPTARARLRRELSTMRRVRHRCIAGVIDADLEHDRPYLVTEFVHGPQLDDYLDRVGPLAREGLVSLGRGLIGALGAIHDAGIVHRDLKPGNILLTDGHPVVIDFGIAQLADDVRLTMTGLFVGTPGYVAPEVIYGQAGTPATDWWGWAATMVYAATGQSPSGTGPIEVVLDRIRRGELRLNGVDPDLQPLLTDCLATDPEARPPADEVISRFTQYAAGHATGPARTVSPAPISEPPSLVRPEQPKTKVLPQPEGPPALRKEDKPPEKNRPRREKAVKSRTPRPVYAAPRGGTLGALAVLLIAIGASMPLIATAVVLGLVTVARFIQRFTTGLQWREDAAGYRKRNLVLELAVSPWNVAVSVATGAATLIAPLAVGATALLALGVAPSIAELGVRQPNIELAIATALALLTLWSGPGGKSTRISAREAAKRLTAGKFGATVLAGTFLIGALFFLLLMVQFPSVNWWPLTGPPDFLR